MKIQTAPIYVHLTSSNLKKTLKKVTDTSGDYRRVAGFY